MDTHSRSNTPVQNKSLRGLLFPSTVKLLSKTGKLWQSRLCAPIFALAGVVISLGAVSLWGIHTEASNNTISALIIILLIVGLGLILLLMLRLQKNLLEPLTHLRNWTLDMRDGNLESRIPMPKSGEFAQLAKDINDLGDKFQKLSNDMQNQVRKQTRHIEQKTRSLEIIYDVAASINVARDLDDLLTRFLQTLKHVVKARAAVVRLMSHDGEMRLVSSIGLDEEVVQREQLIPSSECICGSAYKNSAVLFQQDLQQCDKIIGHSFFDSSDVGMIVVPLQYRDKTLGVYNLFVDKPIFAEQEDIVDLLTSIGRHLGMAIDKARSDDESNRLSIMEERTRLAHELHDSLAQTLASLRFQVRVLDETLRQGKEPEVWFELEKIENNLDEAYGELRELITHFRAPIDKRGLIPAVEHLIERFRNQGDFSIYLQNEWHVLQLPASIEIQVMRIIQEALNNIRKHSQANAVRVILRSDMHGNCKILIEDDGIGMTLPTQEDKTSGDHLGLSIMEERAQHFHGTVRIESEPGEGTCILLQFQYPEPESKSEDKTVTLTQNGVNL